MLGIIVVLDESSDPILRTLQSIAEQTVSFWAVFLVITTDAFDPSVIQQTFGEASIGKVNVVPTSSGRPAEALQEELENTDSKFITFVRSGDRLATDFVQEALGLLQFTGAESFVSGRLQSSPDHRTFQLIDQSSLLSEGFHGAWWAILVFIDVGHARVDPGYAGKVVSSNLVGKRFLTLALKRIRTAGLLNVYPILRSARGLCGSSKGLYIDYCQAPKP